MRVYTRWHANFLIQKLKCHAVPWLKGGVIRLCSFVGALSTATWIA